MKRIVWFLWNARKNRVKESILYDFFQEKGFFNKENFKIYESFINSDSMKSGGERETRLTRIGRTECAFCFKEAPNKKEFKQCGNCKLVSYCSRECQKNHWEVHKL